MRQEVKQSTAQSFSPSSTPFVHCLSNTSIMSKVKAPKAKGIPNRHLHARSTFLYQAATYLTLQTATQDNEALTGVTRGERVAPRDDSNNQKHSPLALQLGSDLQQVSRKGQLRLAVDLKRSLCKRCNTILIPGRTATQTIENPSKGGKKPWADVLVVSCNLCGGIKKFPVGATKQLRKDKRKVAHLVATPTISPGDTQHSDSTTLTDTDQTDQTSTPR
jgi:ribonuclease P protein subunit RPR2